MKLYMAAILAIAFLDIFSEGFVRGSFGSQLMPTSQCINFYTDKIDVRRISGYEEQERPVKAVIFITKDAIRICVPHDLHWVRTAIQKLNQRPKVLNQRPRVLKKSKSSSRRRATSTYRPTARTS